FDREAEGAAELLPVERVLHRVAQRAEREASRSGKLSWLQRVAAGEGIGGVENVVPEEAIHAAMKVVGAGLAHDVDGSPAAGADLGGVVGAVDLELLHRILAQIHQHAARIAVELAAIHSDVVAPAVAAIHGQAALWRLPHAKVGAVDVAGIVDGWIQ